MVNAGTNFPQMSLERCVREGRQPGLDDEVAAWVFSGNARGVFGL